MSLSLNSLTKLRSNLHEEPGEKQNYVYTLPPLKNLHREPFSVIYFFFHHPTCLEMTMPTASRAHLFTRWRLFFQVAKNYQVLYQTIRGVF
jgi:hypothetical protein